jgi:opacity protein-like surface antigen
MKKLFTTFALLALASAGAQAVDLKPYYVGGHVGANNIDEWPAEVNFGGPSTPAQLKLDKGLHLGLFAGRRTENARFEVEYQHGQADVTGVSLGPVSQAAGGHASYQALTLNAYRTYAFSPRFTGYAGLGIGWGKVSLPRLAPLGTCNCFQAASDGGFVYQGRLGVEYQVADTHFVFAQYTLLHLPSSAADATPSVHYGSKNVGALSVGYRAGF